MASSVSAQVDELLAVIGQVLSIAGQPNDGCAVSSARAGLSTVLQRRPLSVSFAEDMGFAFRSLAEGS